MQVLLLPSQRLQITHGAQAAQYRVPFVLLAPIPCSEMQHLVSHATADSMVLMLAWHKLNALDLAIRDTTVLLEAQVQCRTRAVMQTSIARLLLQLEPLHPLLSHLDTTQSR